MITEQYTKPKPLSASIAEAMDEIADRLLKAQYQIARSSYNQRSDNHLTLRTILFNKIYTINSSADPSLIINYPKTIRFLDLRLTSQGRKKKTYEPIYNRPLFGHIYGNGYSLTNIINMSLRNNIHEVFTKEFKKTIITI